MRQPLDLRLTRRVAMFDAFSFLRRITRGALVLAAVVLAAGVADAKITIRPDAPNDSFFFHGNYSSVPFDPSDDFGIAVYNCANGILPIFVSDVVPLVICGEDGGGGFLLAQQVYTVEVPGGTCDDHGSSCYYRNRNVDESTGGVSYFRVRYARNGFGNRVWLQSYGDLADADQANMMLVITINGVPRALLQDTFRPLRNGGWFSRF
jgi:hypothetical protein